MKNKELNPVCFTNDYKYDEKIVIYPSEAEVLNTIASYYANEVQMINDPNQPNNYREWYKQHVLGVHKQLQEVLPLLDVEHPHVYNFTKLPGFIRQLSFAARYDDILNEEELLILDTLSKRVTALQRGFEKWALIIPSFEYDSTGFRLTKADIYKILSAESVVRKREYEYYYEWYATIDELNVLLEKIDKVLQNPMVSCYVFTFRKNVIKLIKRLVNYGRDNHELAAD